MNYRTKSYIAARKRAASTSNKPAANKSAAGTSNKASASKFAALYDAAVAAGTAAGDARIPEPMIVGTPGRGDEFRTDRPIYHVSGGVCGFAWVTIPGTCGLARWGRDNGVGHKGYPSGWSFYVHEHGQSLECKSAHAYAFAEVLRAAGIKAEITSRMD